jgi:hypothetical protein
LSQLWIELFPWFHSQPVHYWYIQKLLILYVDCVLCYVFVRYKMFW